MHRRLNDWNDLNGWNGWNHSVSGVMPLRSELAANPLLCAEFFSQSTQVSLNPIRRTQAPHATNAAR
jgi:hypothetical protein